MFISFEGIDGSGKSTQAHRLARHLRGQGCTVTEVREPGGTRLSESVRALLLDPDLEVSPVAEMLLFSAARAHLVATVIRPALDAGAIVIADRFADSTMAYQGFGRKVCDAETLAAVQRCATGGLTPDLTFLLDLPPEAAAARRTRRAADRMEQAGEPFYRRVRGGYQRLAEIYPARIRVLDATDEPDAIAEHIASAVDELATKRASSRRA